MGAKIDIEVAVGRISGQVQLAHADDICDGLGFEKVNFDQWSKEMQAATFGEQSLIVASMYRLLGENEVDGIGAAYFCKLFQRIITESLRNSCCKILIKFFQFFDIIHSISDYYIFYDNIFIYSCQDFWIAILDIFWHSTTD